MVTKKFAPGKRRFWLMMPDKEFLEQVKRILKPIPGIKGLNTIRHKIIRIHELSDLIKEDQFAVFHRNSRGKNDVEITQTMIREVLREWLDLYGIVHLKKATATAIDAPTGSVLLFVPQALMKIPASHDDYLAGVRRETRKAIRLAEKQGYEYKEFTWDDRLNEIYEINTSKEMRQSIPMHGWYREPVQPRHPSKEELLFQKYYGAFKEEKLVAYFHYWICGDFAVGKHFIGHAQHLKFGIMNGLVSYAVQECVRNSQLQWIYYGTYNEGSLGSFKKHAGFQRYAILVDLDDDQELLRYSEEKVRTIWHL